MPKKESRGASCCGDDGCGLSCACRGSWDSDCCQVESIVTIDQRGQLVLPKDVREKAGIRPADKLAVVSWRQGGTVCCLSLQRADDLSSYVARTYGPLLSGIARSK
jgi:antitoxin PrlF